MRTALAATILAAAAAAPAPVPLAAQGDIPTTMADSLARLGLPADPLDFPALVKADGKYAMRMLSMGCPSDGGWAGPAFDAMERAAQADPELYNAFYSKITGALATARNRDDHDWCPRDHDRIIRLLIEELRRLYEAGLMDAGRQEGTIASWLIDGLEVSDSPEAYPLIRDILHDTSVNAWDREDAFSALKRMRHRMYGETMEEARRVVTENAAKAGIRWIPCSLCTHGVP